jgi:hypothetical protein
MEHSVTLLLLMALSFGLLLFTVGSGKPGKAAADSTEDNPSSRFSLDSPETSRSF